MKKYKAGDTVKLKPIEEWEFDEDGEHIGLTKNYCMMYAGNVYNIQDVHYVDGDYCIEIKRNAYGTFSANVIDENWEDYSREKETNPIKPKHYNSKIDVYDFCLANNLGLLEGNCIKYLTRYKNKNGLEDLLKAQETLKRLIKHYESN
jgi:hypothetical protein